MIVFIIKYSDFLAWFKRSTVQRPAPIQNLHRLTLTRTNQILTVRLIWWRSRHQYVCKSASASVQRSANQRLPTSCSPTNGEAPRRGSADGLYTGERSAMSNSRDSEKTQRQERQTRPWDYCLLPQLSGNNISHLLSSFTFKLLF